MILTKSEINQSIKLDDGDIDKLKDFPGNIYLVNNNSGSINTQNTQNSLQSEGLADSIYKLYKEGVGYYAIVDRVKFLLMCLAMADCGTAVAASYRLKVSNRTVERYMYGNKNAIPVRTRYEKKLIDDKCE